jgi:hypothetical protein
MARGTITAQSAPGSYTTGGAALTWTTGDSTNGHEVTAVGKLLIIVRNDDTGAQAPTILSVTDRFGRTGDLTFSIAANAYRMFGVMETEGFRQSDGNIYIDVADNNLMIAVIDVT